MNKEIGFDRKKLIDEMLKLPSMVLDTAYRYAVSYTRYGEDVTQKWLTSIAKTRALECVYHRGYYDALTSKWIKTSDHLPAQYQDVIVTTEDGYVDIAEYNGINSWTNRDGFYYENSEIIAWQPLPDAYKEAEKHGE